MQVLPAPESLRMPERLRENARRLDSSPGLIGELFQLARTVTHSSRGTFEDAVLSGAWVLRTAIGSSVESQRGSTGLPWPSWLALLSVCSPFASAGVTDGPPWERTPEHDYVRSADYITVTPSFVKKLR